MATSNGKAASIGQATRPQFAGATATASTNAHTDGNEPGEWGTQGIGHLSASSGSLFDDADADPDTLDSPVSVLPSPCDNAVTDSLDDDCMPTTDGIVTATAPNINRWHPSTNCGTWLETNPTAKHPIPVRVILCNIVWHLRNETCSLEGDYWHCFSLVC